MRGVVRLCRQNFPNRLVSSKWLAGTPAADGAMPGPASNTKYGDESMEA